MKHITLAAACALTLTMIAPQADAQLAIKGKSAQALHCAAIQFSVSEVLFSGGLIDPSDRDAGQLKAVRYLNHVPGDDRTKMKAMKKRLVQLLDSRSLLDLVSEWDKSRKWCARTFS
ncbi:hypothetical protein [Actibacterium sp. 188UL27-1]|uniref:hypothetical protein n=1 Tax=Actibacterium sp. 188UL27-1 TaxID=2786961 RepID=UPI00195CC782|nr:hypothetical protein [Actibacterium sp. 188UL27-1]MBM7067787.1 hypothetical protein [Actibacterium sp. 188UL27-1]